MTDAERIIILASDGEEEKYTGGMPIKFVEAAKDE